MSGVKERHWVERAACHGMDTATFFPEQGEDTRPAKEICQGCPVKDECYTYSLEISTHHGIWGGKSERERRGNRPNWVREPLPIRHGTDSGYNAHNRRGLPACQECRTAHSVHNAWIKANRRAGSGN